MTGLVHVATGYASYDSLLWDIRDLEIRGSGSSMRVYSATGGGGGLLVWNPSTGCTVTDYEYAAGGPSVGAQYRIESGWLNGAEYLFYYGSNTSQVSAYRIAADGTLQGVSTVPVGLTSVLGFESVTLASGGSAVYATANGSGLVAGYTAPSSTTLKPTNFINLGTDGQINALTDLEQVTVSGATYLLAVSMYGNSLTSLRVNADGSTTIADSLGIPDGLAVNRLYRVETVSLAGKAFALMVATGTGSLSVVEVGAGGSLTLRDQVNDDLSTRFQSASSLATATLDGRAYVAVAGADDGLSLFTLLPNGRLLLLDTIADSATLALDNVSALAMSGANGVLDLFVTSQTEVGLTHLQYDPGDQAAIKYAAAAGGALSGAAQGDLLWGGAAADTLYGNAGDDILYDGGGSDVLWGGAGADTFVLAKDGQIDVIRDFDITQDRIDLSEWGMIYSLAFLQLDATSYGLRVRSGAEDLRVYSSTGTTIDPAALRFDQVSNAWHVDLNLPQVNQLLQGSAAGELLNAGSGADTLLGMGGSDTLLGGGGNDLLIGDTRDAGYDLVAAQVFRLYRATLARDPDAAGHASWTDKIYSGAKTLEATVTGFVNSKEFLRTYGSTSDAEFVTLLYNNVLGRDPDAGGFQSWTTALSSHTRTREQVVLGFSESKEFQGNTSDEIHGFTRLGHQMDWTDDVFRLYQATLDRAPDKGGLLDWSARLAAGWSYDAVVTGFVASKEFQAKYGATTNAQFVTLLYNNVLDRAPDAGGFAAWTSSLDSGALTREKVVAGFAQSKEFVNTTAATNLTYIRSLGIDDHLDGGSGSNTLVGGMLADCFEFTMADRGTHSVGDLERWDYIALEGFGYADAAAALSHFAVSGEDMVFSDQGTVITFIDAAGAIYSDMLLV